jgi:putative intracellular protease/amidase
MNMYLYVLNTLADWEIGYLTAEVNSKRYFSSDSIDCNIITVGNNRLPITTMGGISIIPDITINEMDIQRNDILILPGANTWLNSDNDEILETAKKRIENDLLVAAICGATIGLARTGSLNNKKHTSNDKDFLCKITTEYKGSDNYLAISAVNDRNLITASGQSAFEFTYEIIRTLSLFKPNTLEAWKKLNLTNEPKYFYEMMKTLDDING